VHGAEIAGSERTSLIAHEPVFTMSQLALPQIDYVALGHIHRFQDRNKGASPPVVYSSSLERITFKEWDDRKGFVLVEIDTRGGEKQTAYTFVDTPARAFIPIAVDAREAPDPTETILAAIARHDLTDSVVRVRYHIEESQTPLIDVHRIRDALKAAYTTASIERVIDPTERQRRTVVTREASLKDAMEQYIAQHDNLTSIKDQLVDAALKLEEDYEAKRREEA
jgi:exonuclease SbcD